MLEFTKATPRLVLGILRIELLLELPDKIDPSRNVTRTSFDISIPTSPPQSRGVFQVSHGRLDLHRIFHDVDPIHVLLHFPQKIINRPCLSLPNERRGFGKSTFGAWLLVLPPPLAMTRLAKLTSA